MYMYMLVYKYVKYGRSLMILLVALYLICGGFMGKNVTSIAGLWPLDSYLISTPKPIEIKLSALSGDNKIYVKNVHFEIDTALIIKSTLTVFASFHQTNNDCSLIFNSQKWNDCVYGKSISRRFITMLTQRAWLVWYYSAKRDQYGVFLETRNNIYGQATRNVVPPVFLNMSMRKNERPNMADK
uniref:Uncharacterized protein n=1 Tax=Glossina brevipalpis TaxID=37001 RepID=A0A1A9WNQ3_9MUSC